MTYLGAMLSLRTSCARNQATPIAPTAAFRHANFVSASVIGSSGLERLPRSAPPKPERGRSPSRSPCVAHHSFTGCAIGAAAAARAILISVLCAAPVKKRAPRQQSAGRLTSSSSRCSLSRSSSSISASTSTTSAPTPGDACTALSLCCGRECVQRRRTRTRTLRDGGRRRRRTGAGAGGATRPQSALSAQHCGLLQR